jgi:hypothetical protein
LLPLVLLLSACSTPAIDFDGRFRTLQDMSIVDGDRSFHAYLCQALDRLSPSDRAYFFKAAIQAIRRVDSNSGVVQGVAADGRDIRVIRLTRRTAFFSVTWLAGVLVHEACHVIEPRQSLPVGSGGERKDMASLSRARIAEENQCLARQLEALESMAAPATELTHLRGQDGSHALTSPALQDW